MLPEGRTVSAKYWAAADHIAANLPDTDVRPADEIGLAAVQVLVHLWADTGKKRDAYLFRAIVCLRQICADSPACMQARYLLVRLYRLVGEASSRDNGYS
jgi:N-terminal acetyltransferase B complex non-catalytic subunit